MFDGFKFLNLIVLCNETLKSKLGVSLSVCSDTGELVNEAKEIKYKGLIFEFKGNYVNLRGSIHKYWNNGEHNYNDFTTSNLLEAIEKLQKEFEINIFESRLNNIEFGVNLIVPFKADKFIRTLIFHGGLEWTLVDNQTMCFCEFEHSKYYLKIYDKGKQYRKTHDIQDEIIRVEIKVRKMEYLHTKGIKIEFLSDLLNTSYYEALGGLLLDTFKDVLIFDETVDLTLLNAKQKDFYQSANNFNYWSNQMNMYRQLKSIDRNESDAKYRQFNRLETNFKNIVKQYSLHNKGQIVETLIAEKWNELTVVTPTLQEQINSYLTNQKCHKRTDFYKSSLSEKCHIRIPSIYYPFSNSQCTVTGLNKARGNTKYLSVNDVKDYAENNTQIFENLKQKYFTPKKDRSYSDNDIYYLIAHNIRNSDTNHRNNLKRQILKSHTGPTLFNKNEYLVLKDEHKKQLSYWNGTPYEIQLNGVL
jgi:hypothetical protein